MKVTHIISSIDTSTGGPARSVTHLISHLAQADASLSLGLQTGVSKDPIIQSFETKQIELNFNHYSKTGGFKAFSKTLKTQQANLLHGHGLWQMPVHQMARYARKNNVPYILTPRGMMEPWSLEQSRLKKQLAMKLYQVKDLKKAACIHATATMEAENIRAMGFKNPVAVIPNGVSLEDYPLKLSVSKTGPRTLLFLSRIHYKKGIELLVEAWKVLAPELKVNWQVQIVGNAEPDYLQELNQMIAEHGQSNSIIIKPPMYGADKIETYQNADLFVLPTYSENFGVVVAEALACGTPVITTHGTPWEDLERYACGWWIPTGVKALQACLETALKVPQAELQAMGLRGRALIEERYSMTAVAEQMLELYHWILNKEKQPNFVYLD